MDRERKPKVIQLLLNLKIGGAERFVVDLANEFSKSGESIICLTEPFEGQNAYYKDYLQSDVRVEVLGFSRNALFRYFFSVFRLITIEKPTVIHFHAPSLVLPFIPALLLFYKRITFIQTIHTNPNFVRYRWFEIIFLKLIYKWGLVKTVAVSKQTSKQFKEVFACECTKVIYNARFNLPDLSTQDSSPFELKDSQGYVKLLHIGRYDLVKNQQMLFEVITRLRNEGVTVSLYVIGNGFYEAGLQKAFPEIIFLGERSNVTDYLNCADGLCISSVSEAMPLVLIEAMSVGCIPIATNVGGIGEIICDGVNGFLSNEVSAESYYETLLRFITNKAQISKEQIVFDYNYYFNPAVCLSAYNKIYRV